MSINDHQALYLAHLLTCQGPSDSLSKLAGALFDAQVTLNPHQVDAALFAFRSPLSKGAILADEVGLGKTIEAGLVISQKWAERKRRILVICPASLRMQWNQELREKFFLSSKILEAKSFNAEINQGNLNPFEQDEIVLCSYQFASGKRGWLQRVEWDLVVIDEAHRLRNVYRNSAKTAKALKEALQPFHKVLLTATPLQNSLLELYGLVSIIDDTLFGDLNSFRAQYSHAKEEDLLQLRERLRPVCQRTLRRQVREYVKYTERLPLVQEFYPSEDESTLYDLVSEYLQREILQALPSSQRKLMTLMVRKLLASSTYAIAGTLDKLVKRLEKLIAEANPDALENTDELSQDFDTFEELAEEWRKSPQRKALDDEKELQDDDGEDEQPKATRVLDLAAAKIELTELRSMAELAHSVKHNSKGAQLLTALSRAFEETERLGGARKAIIFTESTRTQSYLKEFLGQNGYAEQIVLFNGSNSDADSKAIYSEWMKSHQHTDRCTGSRTSDTRTALVDKFRSDATLMIATESAAEGVNLQFCSLMVNFDMPWNPQRVEQRIGRCHRYGQQHDVVVVNFLNKKNAADERVYKLLHEKFRLFDGVFGASDEILGAIEGGVDIEQRIADIYQRCKTAEDIQTAFDDLENDLDVLTRKQDELTLTKQKLLENFDAEVTEKLRINLETSREYLGRMEQWLWKLTQYALSPYASFDQERYAFELLASPSGNIPLGLYRMEKDVEDAHIYRLGHPLAEWVLQTTLAKTAPTVEIAFHISSAAQKVSALDAYLGQSGWMQLVRIKLDSLETEEHLILTAVSDQGEIIPIELSARLLESPSQVLGSSQSSGVACSPEMLGWLQNTTEKFKSELLESLETRNAEHFEEENRKLELWGEDQRAAMKTKMRDFDDEIKELKKRKNSQASAMERVKLTQAINRKQQEKDEAWRAYDQASKEIYGRIDALAESIMARMQAKCQQEAIFSLRWRIA